jgi:hypothetical protein
MSRVATPTMAVAGAMADETVGRLAELYLGNILYAIELAAVSLESQGRRDDAAFYRGIARKLAEAHGRAAGGGRIPASEPHAGEVGDSPEGGAPRGAY